MKDKKNLWFATVEVKAINDNKDLNGVLGAFVNVLCVAFNKKDFISQMNNTFDYNDFQIVEVEDIAKIKNTSSLDLDTFEEIEKLDLIEDLKIVNKTMFWGNFHTYEE